jgi:thiol-disulfide isomerase/thioredoxin
MRGHRGVTAFAVLAFCLLALAPLFAAEGPIADFQLADYVVTVDGAQVDAEVWQSRFAGEMLIVGNEFDSPLRLVLREARVETVQFMKVDKRTDGGLTLLPDATEQVLGKFKVSPMGDGVSFEADGHAIGLRQKPPLLGTQDLGGMKAYSRDYVRLAESYAPSQAFIDRLRAESRPVRVEVYFGSWCPFCQEMVPRMMRVAEELVGSKIEVGFYGLPQGDGFSQDPKVKSLKITGVPTGVVYLEGREVGRISANGWKIPELTLNGLLVKQ